MSILISTKCLHAALTLLLLVGVGCASKPVAQAPPPTPPQPKQSVIVLLPDPDGKPGGITVTNPAGAQTLTQPYQAVHIARADTAPAPPTSMEQAEVRRVFGDVLDALPKAEVVFTLYFGENSESLLPESQAQMPAILAAIRERHSTAISIVGHTDMTASTDFNYRLGLRRANTVSAILHAQGVELSDIFPSSHGETDPVVKTARGVSEKLNRRVEMIVR